MPRKRITVTVDEPTAEYLANAANTSAVVCEAIHEYRARELEKELEAAYRVDPCDRDWFFQLGFEQIDLVGVGMNVGNDRQF